MCPKTHLGHKAFLGLPQLGEQGALLHVHLGDLGTEDSHTFLYVNFFHPEKTTGRRILDTQQKKRCTGTSLEKTTLLALIKSHFIQARVSRTSSNAFLRGGEH